eukprot:1137684-Prorocentrum_minimum.AAC.3
MLWWSQGRARRLGGPTPRTTSPGQRWVFNIVNLCKHPITLSKPKSLSVISNPGDAHALSSPRKLETVQGPPFHQAPPPI